MKRAWRWPLGGFVVGALVGATILTVNVVGASSPEPPAAAHSFGEILHTPPLIVKHDDPVKLTFDVVCGMLEDRPRPRCSPSGTVYARASGEHEFDALPLSKEPGGLLSAELPSRYTSGSGFDYYVEIEDGWGASERLPKSGMDAPQQVWTIAEWSRIPLESLGTGRMRSPDSVPATFVWGKGEGALGLDSSREQSRIGPSAFDVALDGSLVVLDQVNRRLVVMHRGKRSDLPIAFAGGEGDLAVGRDGTIYVLDAGSAKPSVAAFNRAGDLIAETPLAEPIADMVRAGPSGPIVHAYPSEMWLPTGAGRPPLTPEHQIAGARTARSVDGGVGVVVSATPAEARLALVRGDRVVHAWLLRGSESLGEVQLAEPYGDGLLVVVRLWSEKRAEFRVLQLAPNGLVESFVVDRAEWAESASLSRFRLRASTLYQLRSAPRGVEIAAFQIGGTS
ncbi:MAG: hypothetical protein ACRDNP_08985 [Gaiellaceae bacterium]